MCQLSQSLKMFLNLNLVKLDQSRCQMQIQESLSLSNPIPQNPERMERRQRVPPSPEERIIRPPLVSASVLTMMSGVIGLLVPSLRLPTTTGTITSLPLTITTSITNSRVITCYSRYMI